MEVPGDFEEFYAATHDRLIVTLAVLVGDLDVARDAVDEAFERAVMRWPRVARMDSPAGWTFRVALNAARRQHRRRAIEGRLLRRTEPVATLHTSTVEVTELLGHLPPRQRAAMTLRVLGGLSETEIAQALSVSRSTVQSALTDARRNLTAVMAETLTGETNEDAARPR